MFDEELVCLFRTNASVCTPALQTLRPLRFSMCALCKLVHAARSFREHCVETERDEFETDLILAFEQDFKLILANLPLMTKIQAGCCGLSADVQFEN